MIIFDRTICADFGEASSREWLETNGIGGFASGTIAGANTRRYHATLTAATEPPLGRITTVSKIEETVHIGGVGYELSSNQYPGNVHPQGFRFVRLFRLDPFPLWEFEVDGVVIEKKVFMVYGRNMTVCRWSFKRLQRRDRRPVSLSIRPMLSFVDYHHLRQETSGFDGSFAIDGDVVSMQPVDGMPPVFFHAAAARVEETGHWYRNFEYALERERGFDFRENLFQPFEMKFDGARSVSLLVSTDPIGAEDPARLERAEVKRRRSLVRVARRKSDLEEQLVLAADQFIVKRGSGHTVIAGYPWFSDWGRDTMIALPGLSLATGRHDIARDILLEFSNHVSEGMIPNRFPDAGSEAEYNTVDATLWYFEAVRAYLAATGDIALIRDRIYPKLADILVWHLRGTRYNIHVDTDGLLYAGEHGVQLTWMDAKVGDQVITPRTGKAVEIQALWYNALRIMADLAARFGDDQDRARYIAMADLAKLSFNALFWNEETQCFYDVVENGDRDGSVRPNQIFAVSLPYSMVDGEKARKIVDKVEAELLTPVGLRSLAPSDSRYVPIYIGSPLERDSAYHQGTVWAWLIGPFIDAYRRVYPERYDRIDMLLSGFASHLREAGIGQVSEIFDGDAPHAARGCPAQAWSVGELLRTLMGQE